MKSDTSNEQLKTISTATYLEEANQPRLLLITSVFLAVFLFCILMWAIFTNVKERALTYGKLVPTSGVITVQHLEGGIVKSVYVNNGDIVNAGQPLLDMDTTSVQAELNQLYSKHAALLLDAQRLNSFLNWEEPNPQKWLATIVETIPEISNDIVQLTASVQDETHLLENQNQKRHDQISVVNEQINQNKEELLKVESDIRSLERNLELQEEELAIYDALIKKGHISKRDYIISQKQANKSKGELDRLRLQAQKAQFSIAESTERKEKTISELREQASQELDKINSKLLEFSHIGQRLEDKLHRSKIVSSINGIINGLEINSGAVIPPGAKIMDIVPTDKALKIASKINPKDIGHIRVGDLVKIRVTTFDFAEYGSIEGRLQTISATTFEDDKGLPYYKAEITLNQQSMKGNTKQAKLLPGMTVEASIITGEKSIMAYLLKPIRRSMDNSFSER